MLLLCSGCVCPCCSCWHCDVSMGEWLGCCHHRSMCVYYRWPERVMNLHCVRCLHHVFHHLVLLCPFLAVHGSDRPYCCANHGWCDDVGNSVRLPIQDQNDVGAGGSMANTIHRTIRHSSQGSNLRTMNPSDSRSLVCATTMDPSSNSPNRTDHRMQCRTKGCRHSSRTEGCGNDGYGWCRHTDRPQPDIPAYRAQPESGCHCTAEFRQW